MSYLENLVPVRKDNILTSGVHDPAGFVCEEDGTLTIIWEDDSTVDFEMTKGDTKRFFSNDCKSVTIVSGTFIKL